MSKISDRVAQRFASNPTETEDLEDVGDLEVAEYIIFLLAVDTYMRYLHEAAGENVQDDVMHRGIMLVKMADRMHSEAMQKFLQGHLTTEPQKKMLAKAFRFLPTADGLGRRSLQLRTLLSRGGASTMRAVFKNNRALTEVRAAISASMSDDADAALDKFGAIAIKNVKLRTWIDNAAKTAGSGTFQNAVSAAAKTTTDDATTLLKAGVHQAGTSANSEESKIASDHHADIMLQAQQEAQETAQKAMEVSGEPDGVPTKSEVIGIASAVALATVSDPSRNANVPVSLQSLDPEQRSAAMTDGRVLIAASAGSGKSTTLVSRVAYLVQERKVSPSRIFVTSFNTKAAKELQEKIASKVGQDTMKQMSVGTMHSLFKRFVVEYGTPEEKAALVTWKIAPPDKRAAKSMNRGPTPGAFGGVMARIWKECKGSEPPAKASSVMQGWLMNDITPEQAKLEATDATERDQAEWYKWTLGFKGVDKTWVPPCLNTNKKVASQWGSFLATYRDNGRARLGDFSDMIIMFRDLLKRNPSVKAKIQGMYDQVCVDESQDLNQVQHEAIALMTEHITDGKDGKSVYLIGDPKQCINRFVGARPELFTQFANKPDWKVKSIATNYRCLPEIVETANKLMSNHPEDLKLEAKPDAAKPRGAASIVLQEPSSHAAGAMSVIGRIKQDVDAGEALSDNAVLTRTNAEINDYETACIIQGVPYGRKGGTSFLRSTETRTVMSYFNLAVGQDFERMQLSLAEVFNKPNRFFLKAGQAETIVPEAVEVRARKLGVSTKSVNPLDLFDREGINAFIDIIDSSRRMQDWQLRGVRVELEKLSQSLKGMRSSADAGETTDRYGVPKKYTTQDLFGDILKMEGAPDKNKPVLLRDVLMPSYRSAEDEADALSDPSGDENKKPMGNVEFLYKIAEPDPANPEVDPSNPRKFKAKIDQLVAASRDLRVDLDSWDTEQDKLPPSERKSPDCVILSTIHSVKGSQWNNTTVVMAKGVFPYQPKPRQGDEELSPTAAATLAEKRQAEFLTERQLAYVAMTRAAKNLTIVCPGTTAYGNKGGVSSFVMEAGLTLGQNVEGKNDPTPSTEGVSLTASFFAGPDTREPEAVFPSYGRGN